MDFAISGIPLILVVFALVEEVKAYGLDGKPLRAVSLILGLLLASGYQLSIAMPASPAAWLQVVIVGLAYGLTASGAYDFINSRIPKVA